MKQIINFIITFIILYLGNLIAPDYIVSDSWKTLLLATAIIFVAELIAELIVFVIAIITTILDSKFVSEALIIIVYAIVFAIALLSSAIALKVAVNVVPNFAINGIWTYIIVAVLMTFLSVSGSSKK